ncbi:hypothetical protein KIN20_010842, partial [Parelaphostrongylus tenuis]
MSLFWERAVSTTPCALNVEHPKVNETFGAQQSQTGNWDNINLGSVSSPQQYHWNDHVDVLTNRNHSSTPTYSDSYGAAVMSTNEQGTQNVTYPSSTGNCVQSTNNSYIGVLDRSEIIQQEEQQSRHPKLPIPPLVPSQRVQHTLIPTKHHTQEMKNQSQNAE